MIAVSKKICLLGDFAVGKTSLVRRFVYDRFEDKYLSTIGVKVSRKVVAIPNNDDVIELTIMLWDLAGTEEFDGVRSSYLRGSAGALIVCDVTRPETLATAKSYAADLHDVSPGALLVLAANKSDLRSHEQMSGQHIAAVAAELCAPFFATSARTGAGVDEAFRALGRAVAVRQAS